jgi:Helix-turn-helix domain
MLLPTPNHFADFGKMVDPARQLRSLRCCHRYAIDERPRHPAPRDTGAYIPELAARIEDDRNLCDGARRCARKLAEYGYLRHRDDRACRITISYLARSLGRCRRTVQRYLRQLEQAGYIDTLVMQSGVRMCTGLTVRLLSPLFPRHHASKWPSRLVVSGATPASHKQRYSFIPAKITPVPLALWADRCREGVWRSLMSTFTPIPTAL